MFDTSEPSWLRDLNADQRRAVLHRGGPLLVVAGAGSGKTRTLATRVASLIDDGVPPDRILLLTFTRRAAREMLRRAAAITDDRRTGKVWGGTFHSVANRLLRGSGPAVPPSFSVLDQSDAADLFGLVRADLGHGAGARRFPRKETLASIYSRCVNAQEPLTTVLDKQYPWCNAEAKEIAKIFTAYTERKRRHDLFDFDDLLLYWRAVAQASSSSGAMQSLFDHILVDEYQDTNVLQADILDAMCRGAALPTVVGDDAQAIYSFRAASVANIEQFGERYPGATVITLEQNYRSTPQILAAANAVMEAAPRRYPKALWSQRRAGARPELLTCRDETEQSNAVCDAILRHRELGISLKEQAVLFRTGHHSDALELELGRRNIPFLKFGGLKFLDRAHVKDLIALLRVVDNPRDELAWHRVLLLLDGVGPATARRAMAEIGVDRDSAPDGDPLVRFIESRPSLPGTAREAAGELAAAWKDCAGGALGAGAEIERLLPFCKVAFESRYEDAAARLADLEHLAATAVDAGTRSRFLVELTLDPPVKTGAHAGPPHRDDDYLILSTIHSAKGGEWDVVHVIHAADGNIPSDMAIGDPEGLEEERRLLYVALTRARDVLTVSFPLRYYHRHNSGDDAHNYAQLSRFLDPALRCFDVVAATDPSADDPVVGVEADSVEVDALLESLFRS